MVREGSYLLLYMLFLWIKELSNVKEEVYGALDSFIAWELEFPLITVKTLLDEQDWMRVIQVPLHHLFQV